LVLVSQLCFKVKHSAVYVKDDGPQVITGKDLVDLVKISEIT